MHPVCSTESVRIPSTPDVEKSSIDDLIAAILADGEKQYFVAHGQGKLCADLVSTLIGDNSAAKDLKVWTASTSKARDAAHLSEGAKGLALNKLSAVHAPLPRLVEECVRTFQENRSNDVEASPTERQLPKELAERVLESAQLDTMDASVCSDILELLASFDKRVAIVRQLLDQNRRLRDVAVSEETCQLRVDDLLSSVSRRCDFLTSEHERAVGVCGGFFDERTACCPSHALSAAVPVPAYFCWGTARDEWLVTFRTAGAAHASTQTSCRRFSP
ncbi:hypothetical protein V5799_031423 [Amblyomma americanum]|uniref:Uncharacterized protein n=1 Tax=Amblyomma americanum TaxID=6943 RepID=A0AAQ4EKD9_AMBAM